MALCPEAFPSDPAARAELAFGLDAENESLTATIAKLKGLIYGGWSERMPVLRVRSSRHSRLLIYQRWMNG